VCVLTVDTVQRQLVQTYYGTTIFSRPPVEDCVAVPVSLQQ